eukprot:2543208-Pleurochrysis_carterae.AAC.1
MHHKQAINLQTGFLFTAAGDQADYCDPSVNAQTADNAASCWLHNDAHSTDSGNANNSSEEDHSQLDQGGHGENGVG